jgi:predicted nucleic acid-binding protein
MNLVFADAFYFVARLNRRDQHHERVLKFSRDFRARVLTSDWVLMEVADALAESESRSACVILFCISGNRPRVKLFPPRAKRWTARWNCITGTTTRNGR